MGYINYSKLKKAYEKEKDIAETIRRMEEFDGFHLLRDANEGQFEKEYPKIKAKQYKKWMNLCDGGYLFDTTLLSLNEYDNELKLSFDSLKEYNSEEMHKNFGLPDGYFVIAMRNYGDPICISDKDERVYCLELEKGEFTEIWDNFESFLGDETDAAIELIANGDIEPVPLKFAEK